MITELARQSSLELVVVSYSGEKLPFCQGGLGQMEAGLGKEREKPRAGERLSFSRAQRASACKPLFSVLPRPTHLYLLRGCNPTANNTRRTFITPGLFIRKALTVARPVAVTPTMRVKSSFHLKWSCHL